uniref:Uncharacterized protein n=1 Tax=Peronospora matthiolae TaxID=2874970 RepID=A0AAV1U1X9_9STRA
MVNERCASKAAESASARLCADAEALAAATDVSSVAEVTQPVSPGDVGARHEDTHVFTEYEPGVSYSPDTEDGSVSTAIEPSRLPSVAWIMLCVVASLVHLMNQMNHRRSEGARGASPSVGTSQEERDRSVLRLAPEKKAWMPPKSVMDHLSATTSDRYRTRLFDSSRIHHLDPSAKNNRAENEFFIDAFFRHRWYSGKYKRDGPSLLQAWNAYIYNLEDVGRDGWNDKLIKARDKFQKRTQQVHATSCIVCQGRKDYPASLGETRAHVVPWWRVRISSEIYEGIDDLKFLYDRAGETFSSGPSAAQDVPRRTAQPDPVRQPSVGSGAPKYPRTGDSRATGRGNSSDVRSHRGGSTAAQLDSAGHRESPLMEVEEEGKRSTYYRGEACVPESFFDCVTQALRGDLEHERDRRLQLADTVLKHRAEVARGDIDRSRDEITALQTLVDIHHREHKALCEMLERKGVLHQKNQRTDGTD